MVQYLDSFCGRRDVIALSRAPAACRDASQRAVHSLLPIHSCSRSVNSQTAEKGDTARCNPGWGGTRSRAQVFWCQEEQAEVWYDRAVGWRMKGVAEKLSKPWANAFPLPLRQRSIAARTQSEDLMPADVIGTDPGSGRGWRREWEAEQGGKEPSSPLRPLTPGQGHWLQQHF